MLMLNWISSACIVLAGQADPFYVNTKISMAWTNDFFSPPLYNLPIITSQLLSSSILIAVNETKIWYAFLFKETLIMTARLC